MLDILKSILELILPRNLPVLTEIKKVPQGGSLNEKPCVGMISATKETYHLLTRILTVISHSELSTGRQVQKYFEILGHIWSLCCHFHAIFHESEVRND